MNLRFLITNGFGLMPKMKSNRGAAKRFKRTGSGALKRGRSNKRHILTKKGRERKRRLRQGGYVGPNDVAAVNRMLPYR